MAMPSPCETAGRPHTRAVSTSEHRVAAATRRLSRVVRTDCIVLLLDDHFFLHATHQSRGGRDFDALLGQGNKVSQFQLSARRSVFLHHAASPTAAADQVVNGKA